MQQRKLHHGQSAPIVLSLLLAFLLTPIAAADPAAQDLETILDRVRAAIGYEQLIELDGVVRLSGRGIYNGMSGQYGLVFDSGGRAVQEFHGPISAVQGFDGKTVWMLHPTGTSSELELGDRGRVLTNLWLLNGHWLSSCEPLWLRSAPQTASPTTWTIEVAFPDGRYEGLLHIDRETALPVSFSTVVLEE